MKQQVMCYQLLGPVDHRHLQMFGIRVAHYHIHNGTATNNKTIF
jgi:hypothetical protein